MNLTIGPYLLFYVALVGFFGFAAVYHLAAWSGSRRERLLLLFGVDCIIRGILSAALVALMTTTTITGAFQASWVRVGLVLLTFVTTLWTVRLISGRSGSGPGVDADRR